jgi:hypothetical protein
MSALPRPAAEVGQTTAVPGWPASKQAEAGVAYHRRDIVLSPASTFLMPQRGRLDWRLRSLPAGGIVLGAHPWLPQALCPRHTVCWAKERGAGAR